jgi:hypothetical protein
LKFASIAFSDSRSVGIDWSGGGLTGCAAMCVQVRVYDVMSFGHGVAEMGARVVVETGVSCWRGIASHILDLTASRVLYS